MPKTTKVGAKRGKINKRKQRKRRISKRKYMRTKNKQKGGSMTSGKSCRPCTQDCKKTFTTRGLDGLTAQCICNPGKTLCWCNKKCRNDYIEDLEDQLRLKGEKDWSN